MSGCTGEANHLGNPLLWPVYGISSAVENSIYDERRDQVARIVEANFDQIIADIDGGGGPSLTLAMDTALIPAQERPARLQNFQSDLPLYSGNPEALVVAFMVFGP